MRVALLYPIGQHQPGETLDVDPRVGAVLVDGVLAVSVDDAGVPAIAQSRSPTLSQLRSFAVERGVDTSEARRLWADEQRARAREGVQPC